MYFKLNIFDIFITRYVFLCLALKNKIYKIMFILGTARPRKRSTSTMFRRTCRR